MKKSTDPGNATLSYAKSKMTSNIFNELVWFANWTINSFNIYDTIGHNYVNEAPVPANPRCVPPKTPTPTPTYCVEGFGNATSVFDTVNNCTPVVPIQQWQSKPAIQNIATVFYDLYLTPALFIPPCVNLTPVNIEVVCPLNYQDRGSYIAISFLLLFSLVLFIFI